MAIEIQELHNYDHIFVIAKGHHDKDEFIKAWLEYSGGKKGCDPVEMVRHIYMRKTPRPGYKAWFTPSKKGRGAFPVTIMGPIR